MNYLLIVGTSQGLAGIVPVDYLPTAPHILMSFMELFCRIVYRPERVQCLFFRNVRMRRKVYLGDTIARPVVANRRRIKSALAVKGVFE